MTVLVNLGVRALEDWWEETVDVLTPKGACAAMPRVLFDFMDAAKVTIGVSVQDANRRKTVGKPLEFRNIFIETLSISKSEKNVNQKYCPNLPRPPCQFTDAVHISPAILTVISLSKSIYDNVSQ